ncbi:hypothetical protein WJX84_003861 [Apatococcus fuscideae]|uniref:Uncharacterized protein n=1 Tax=Apatococcus fuscideae TaxID=2026836 RepID=A0AAW1TA26_9CHLO
MHPLPGNPPMFEPNDGACLVEKISDAPYPHGLEDTIASMLLLREQLFLYRHPHFQPVPDWTGLNRFLWLEVPDLISAKASTADFDASAGS